MEEAEPGGTILLPCGRGLARNVDFPAAKSASRSVRPIPCARRRCLRGHPHRRFCLERTGPRPALRLGTLRRRLLPRCICHPAKHIRELDSAAIHDRAGADRGVSSHPASLPPPYPPPSLGLTAICSVGLRGTATPGCAVGCLRSAGL